MENAGEQRHQSFAPNLQPLNSNDDVVESESNNEDRFAKIGLVPLATIPEEHATKRANQVEPKLEVIEQPQQDPDDNAGDNIAESEPAPHEVDVRNDEELASEQKHVPEEPINEDLEQPQESDEDPAIVATSYVTGLLKSNLEHEQEEIVNTEPEQVSPEIVENEVASVAEVKEDLVEEEPVQQKDSQVSEETIDAVYYIMYLIATKFNKIVFDESEPSDESEEDEASEEEEITTKVTRRANTSSVSPKKNHKTRPEIKPIVVDPRTMLKNFEKNDDDNIRALKIDILQQAESLSAKLAERRKKDKNPYTKRMSILTPGHLDGHRSIVRNDTEGAVATDPATNTEGDHSHTFTDDHADTNDFNEIFKVLNEIEDNSNIFGNTNAKFESDDTTLPESEQSTAVDTNREEFEKKKEEFLGKPHC